MVDTNGPPRVVFLGPEYTFSHEAAQRFFPDGDLSHLSTFKEVFSIVSQGAMDFGVLPVENSSSGAIAETYQLLLNQEYEPGSQGRVRVRVVGEIIIPIKHNLLSFNNLDVGSVRTIYSNAQPLLQSAEFIASSLPSVRVEPANSTADAAEQTRSDPFGACIGGSLLAEALGLYVIEDGIQDLTRNVTRFFVISAVAEPTGRRNKSTFAIVIPDESGTLVRALELIAENTLDISAIKTLPVNDPSVLRDDFKDWFVIDVRTSEASQKFRRFVSAVLKNHGLFLGVKFLGSYRHFEPQEPNRLLDRSSPAGSPDQLQDLIEGGESSDVEFKSTLRFDLRQERVNKDISRSIVKTLAAFMNTSGGHLFIGVDDAGNAIGIQKDLDTLGRKDTDGFLSTLVQLVVDYIGTEYCQWVRTAFITYQGQTVCAVSVMRSSKPAWVNDGSDSTFFIRAGNSSRQLPARTALEYVLDRFRAV